MLVGITMTRVFRCSAVPLLRCSTVPLFRDRRNGRAAVRSRPKPDRSRRGSAWMVARRGAESTPFSRTGSSTSGAHFEPRARIRAPAQGTPRARRTGARGGRAGCVRHAGRALL